MSTRNRPLSIGLGLAMGACSAGDAPSGGGPIVRDSAGVEIVEVRLPELEWQLGEVPEVRVGVVEGEAVYQMSGVRFAGRLDDGRIVVVNDAGREVRFYDAGGRHRTTLGGRGGGPGEFSAFSSIRLTAGDTLRIHDTPNRRLSVISPGEAIVREHSVAGLEAFARAQRVLGTTSDGRAVVALRPQPMVPAGDHPYVRDTLAVVIVPLDGSTAADTVARVPGQESRREVRQDPGGPTMVMTMQLPFGHSPYYEVVGPVLVLGTSEQPELRLVDADGGLRRIIRRIDASRTTLGAVRARYLAYIEEGARSREGANVEATVRAARDRLAALPDTHRLPTFDLVMVDSEQRIWVRDYVLPWDQAEPQRWTVFEPSGRALARATIPSSINVTHVGREHVTGVIRDELGVEYVVVHRIGGVAPPG